MQEWIKGTTPGVTNRRNHYDLCYALEMDFQQTAVFFQKHYLTMPFNVKSSVDAVFMYALYHKKSYSAVTERLKSLRNLYLRKMPIHRLRRSSPRYWTLMITKNSCGICRSIAIITSNSFSLQKALSAKKSKLCGVSC